jgi:protein-S-isoprenylcysteine O-methyltransferase
VLLAVAIFLLPPLLADPSRLLHPAPWAGFVFAVLTLVTQPALSPRAMVVDADDRLSALAILASVVASELSAVVAFSLRVPLFPSPGSWWVVAGIGIAAAGMALRLAAIRTLGSSFTSTVRVAVGQRLRADGPYRFIRHPAYAGSLLNVLGTVLALGSGAGVGLVCALTLPAYLYRIRVEERALLAGLTPDYARYRARTWRLVPFVV